MMESTTHVSQSMPTYEEDLADLRSQLSKLRNELQDINTIVQYLATTNVELTRDMQLIYDALKEVTSSVDDPYEMFGLSLTDPEDDDMLN